MTNFVCVVPRYVTVASHTDSVLSEICPAGGGDVALEAALPGASSAAGKVDVEGGDGETAAAPASAPTAPPPRSLPSGTKLVERSFFGDIATIFKLGLPGGIMLALEAGAFEITTIFAAQISPIAISAHAIMMQVSGFIYMTFAVSTMIAASVRVGNALGRGIAPAASPSVSETAFDDASEEEKVVAIAALEASREEKVASAAYDARRSAKVCHRILISFHRMTEYFTNLILLFHDYYFAGLDCVRCPRHGVGGGNPVSES